MRPRAIRRPAARRDLLRHYIHLAQSASLEVAHRFRLSVEQTYLDLARMPRNYWIAYHPHPSGVAIERLFHAKEDYTRIIH